MQNLMDETAAYIIAQKQKHAVDVDESLMKGPLGDVSTISLLDRMKVQPCTVETVKADLDRALERFMESQPR